MTGVEVIMPLLGAASSAMGAVSHSSGPRGNSRKLKNAWVKTQNFCLSLEPLLLELENHPEVVELVHEKTQERLKEFCKLVREFAEWPEGLVDGMSEEVESVREDMGNFAAGLAQGFMMTSIWMKSGKVCDKVDAYIAKFEEEWTAIARAFKVHGLDLGL
mmetsp:Transcript_9628/g.28281  ORF Transcript_9628/g.28281 Transcript_9628/m.28281 type:complete len:160 (-) Transcript_9628:159-638(-)|eukprot:CAMPEP_0118872734 /NCGR_PEP_ID=MMETSP1163-20130328/14816_1 /TAXON_ID=124430 /ORGANISM="Phaeomonas parva, Strain CCMP2877" /LENGTH=159 /DNA_ID=CAMNT_0006807951 /DNA_START=67 /DNA_END=546 /DNA_ORIENTATION=+